MNLRKFSQLSYFQAKSQKQQNQQTKAVQQKNMKPIYEFEKKNLKEQFEQNQSNQQTLINQETNEITVSDFEASTHVEKKCKIYIIKVISNPRAKRKHFSPIFRTNNITVDQNSTRFQLSLSREKLLSHDAISLWDSNQRGNKQSSHSVQIEDKQTFISKGSKKKLEKGIKIQQELDEFLKFRHQNIQTQFDCTKLKKFEKRKLKTKISIEYQIDSRIDKQNNEKECQFNGLNNQNQDLYTKLNNSQEQKEKSKNSSSIKSNPLIPIHIRYQYEKEYKDAKQKSNEKLNEQQQYLQRKKVSKDQIEEFFKEQQKFMQKRADFFEKEFEKKLWEASQHESEFLYKPVLNEQSSRILDKKLKGKKFDQRIEQFQQNRQNKIEEQIQNMKPSFTPKISKMSRKLMENPKQKNDNGVQSYNYKAKTQEGQ
ncbi:unnamed protein product (macronuclear) [Paramecium tetraurelia]|uniref:TPX2 C-terminal domain-containing protein n=1 Tax=Paramecium tetraurelia TaxID=5888 RepID=A0BXW6_PARTE|nr:uncharacterized protein GSPATT00033236001 [Paramecium tetraurelia]CAK63383.1 unnamed protein product [Paramecium tetraurelia]|eukprot:XP_001430781.1 hypothetical protein (macronuclear) [Paramecium tetraurelia strain d4-2]